MKKATFFLTVWHIVVNAKVTEITKQETLKLSALFSSPDPPPSSGSITVFCFSALEFDEFSLVLERFILYLQTSWVELWEQCTWVRKRLSLFAKMSGPTDQVMVIFTGRQDILPVMDQQTRWSYPRQFRSLLLCPLSVEHYLLPKFVDSKQYLVELWEEATDHKQSACFSKSLRQSS